MLRKVETSKRVSKVKAEFLLTMAFILVFAGLAQADLARVGPANTPAPPGHGFPFWYQDLTGMVLDICLPNASDPGALQQTACLLGPPDPPYVFPTNFPDEVFYFRAVSTPLDTTGGKRAVLVLALEAAFANGPVVPGDQVVFTRIRVTAGVPVSGTYTLPGGEQGAHRRVPDERCTHEEPRKARQHHRELLHAQSPQLL